MIAWPARLYLAPVLAAYVLSPRLTYAKGGCPKNSTTNEVALWTSPASPKSAKPAFIMAAATTGDLPAGAALTVNGLAIPQTEGAFWRSARLEKLAGGTSRIELVHGQDVLACKEVNARAESRPSSTRTRPVHWPTTQSWNPQFEAHYAAWIDRLFDAPATAALGFRPLSQALQDPERNSLWNHLGLGEDTAASKSALRIEPDCADLPYMLRAYFAWKMGLPFGIHECDRGTSDHPPRCSNFHSNEDATSTLDPLTAFKKFLILLANKAHSGSLRTGLADSTTDFYPVPLTRAALRPGAIFADPYGHVLVVARWVDRPGQPGLLFAVDGQPDKSITRKRFWEGNFLFASDVASAGAGFKAYRPLATSRTTDSVSLAPVPNADLKPPPRAFNNTQATLAPDEFYAQMFKLINPNGLAAEAAYDDTLAALVEQLEARVRSVDNGELHHRETSAEIDMPAGANLFETLGPWEDYATPSRDMRLLIAMQVLLDLPVKLTTRPALFALGGKTPKEVRAALELRHKQQTELRKITYTNSEGVAVVLSVADVLARRKALQVAYNPNDCVEIRWGAAANSAEAKSCKRRAPPAQQTRMEEMRPWFASRRRPTRN